MHARTCAHLTRHTHAQLQPPPYLPISSSLILPLWGSSVDIVCMYSLLFTEEVMAAVAAKALVLRDGARIITARRLNGSGFRTVWKGKVHASFGIDTWYVQVKMPSSGHEGNYSVLQTSFGQAPPTPVSPAAHPLKMVDAHTSIGAASGGASPRCQFNPN